MSLPLRQAVRPGNGKDPQGDVDYPGSRGAVVGEKPGSGGMRLGRVKHPNEYPSVRLGATRGNGRRVEPLAKFVDMTDIFFV
jgi:hypothetical protein